MIFSIFVPEGRIMKKFLFACLALVALACAGKYDFYGAGCTIRYDSHSRVFDFDNTCFHNASLFRLSCTAGNHPHGLNNVTFIFYSNKEVRIYATDVDHNKVDYSSGNFARDLEYNAFTHCEMSYNVSFREVWNRDRDRR